MISDLDRRGQSRFLERQPPKLRAAVERAFSRDPKLRKECENAFLFLIACELIPRLSARRVGKADLYYRFLNRYMRWMKVQEPEMTIDSLAVIAWRMRASRSGPAVPARALLRWLNQGAGITRSLREGIFEYGLIEKEGRLCKFFHETLQEYLCAQHLVASRVLPIDFARYNTGWSYRNVPLSDVVLDFYQSLSGLNRIFGQR